MPILKTGKIQSHGPDVGLTARIAALEDKYVKALWYAEISSGASGTIAPPTGGTIVLNEWGADVDAVTSTITTTKKPDFVSAKTSAGAIVTATLAANGAWTISGAPSAYPIALVYVYEIKLVNFDRAYSLYEEEFTQGLTPSDSPTFVGLTIGSLAGVLKAAAGVLAGSAVHVDLGSIGANDHHNAITLDANADTLLSLSTQALGLDTKAMNLIFAGPVSGAAAVPTFRAMVAADLGTGLIPTFAGLTVNGNISMLSSGNSPYFVLGDDSDNNVLTRWHSTGNYGYIYTSYLGSAAGLLCLQPDGGTVSVGYTTAGEKFDVNGNINATGVIKIDAVQVVSNQGAHVADATDAASVITQLNLLLTRLETHGLLASA